MINIIVKKRVRQVKKAIKSMIRKIEGVLSVTTFVVSGTNKKNKSNLEKLRDSYKGQRCFIICNGPSLRSADLTKIYEHGDLSIGMNAIARIYDQTPWRPTFLSAADDVVFTKKNKELVKNCECGYKLYNRARFLKSLGATEERLYLNLNQSRDLLDDPQFADDATKKLMSIGTTTYGMIEFAVFLGCTEIYILGCDMSYAVNLNRDGTITYNDSGKDYFASKEEYSISSKAKPAPTWEMEIAYNYASKYAKEHGIKIYNATRGGRLEVFERVNFDSLF